MRLEQAFYLQELHAARRKSVIYSSGLHRSILASVQIEPPFLILMSPALFLHAGPSISLQVALSLHRSRTEPSQISASRSPCEGGLAISLCEILYFLVYPGCAEAFREQMEADHLIIS